MSISDKNTKILIVIPKELKSRLEEKAKQNNRSVSNYVVTLVQQNINEKKGRGK